MREKMLELEAALITLFRTFEDETGMEVRFIGTDHDYKTRTIKRVTLTYATKETPE